MGRDDSNHSPGGISFDDMLRKLPQMFQMAHDMHNLTEYISQMRILFMLMMVMGVVGGLVFLLVKSRKDRCKGRAAKYHRCGDLEDSVDSTICRVSDHLYQKQVPAPPRPLPKETLGFQSGQKLVKVPGLTENSV